MVDVEKKEVEVSDREYFAQQVTQMMIQMKAFVVQHAAQNKADIVAQLAGLALARTDEGPASCTTVARTPLTVAGTRTVNTVNTVNIQNNTLTNIAPVVTNNITIQAALNITPWDSPDYITVSIADILAAFAENPKLRQYLHMNDFELTNFEKAPPFIIELYIELLLRAHLIEAARNIYLNPSRSDQVLVRMKSGTWDVAPLNDSIEHLFNGISHRLHVITITTAERTKLPYDIQNAISMCDMMYKDDPDVYIKLAKEVLVAHLTNCRTKLIASGAIVQKTRKSS
jgi:hypothetical protein